MKLIDTFANDNGRVYYIYYLDSFKEYPEINSFMLRNAENLKNEGQALRFWTPETIDYSGVVAIFNGTPAGHMAIRYDQETSLFSDIFTFVDPEHRGQGLALSLEENLKQQARLRGCKAITGYIHDNNTEEMARATQERNWIKIPVRMVAYLLD